jgi:hypothetical protein
MRLSTTRAGTLVAIVGLLLSSGCFAENACDRQCLKDIANRYLDALVKHDPKSAPLAPSFRSTENAKDVALGEGLWQSATALGEFRRVYVDPVQGQAGFFGLIEEQGVPAIVSLRLKVVDRKVAESEAIIGRKGVSLYDPKTLAANGPSDAPLPVHLRSSRAEMIAAAASYFDGAQSQDPSIVRQRPGCDRYENGVKMTHREGRGAGGVSMSGDCAATIANARQIAAVVDRRYPVVDEEAGVVMATAIFNRPPGAKRADGTPWPRLLLTEFFPVENGRITGIYAAMYYLPDDLKDAGWKP